jgi:hypothetical protein
LTVLSIERAACSGEYLDAELLFSAVLAEVATEIGCSVRFLARNVFLPNPEEFAGFAAGCDEWEGTIVGFSDSGIWQGLMPWWK